ncbi:alpha/beta hydrolase family esterase [Mesorhizobium sp. ES1-1]|uniref:extracellular catalytic domain type 1 short-chain-length polyhydroxyalkanoate depolymerase n=1 Tax=Mesorhizobium sp. ES1-1 TaxID=2876629 RepID=UPI001CC94CDF|nr:PHB depolymerase family esterase [Mesorhizobium sp. ES1-1]MBZ9676345.1 PHB depolymerase family esterase [Mesorhizobium sp. ES1-1]
MRNISDTIARLAAMRGGPRPATNIHLDRLSDLGAFGSNPGALRARCYIPSDLPPEAALVVVLHGCTQTASAYDHGSGWSTLADEEGFAVLYPEQQRANNPNLCFDWFVPDDTRRDRGEVLSIRQMIDTVVATHGLDRRRIFVTGLSAGGAMAASMLASYPELFCGGAIIAGLAHGSASTIPQAFDRMRGHGGPTMAELQRRLRDASAHTGPWPPLSIWQGTADTTVAPSNADAILGQWHRVHRIGSGKPRTETVDGHKREVWCDDAGREVIERYTIAGMGHGTPLKTHGEDGLGNAAPFMIEAGISSTRRMATFWGLTRDTDVQRKKTSRQKAPGTAVERRTPVENPRAVRMDHAAEAAKGPQRAAATGISKTIEDALRAAGLMR